ncbi:Gfo/Idh/MocA family oxidoreductase [Listeria sp. PSOL-1]|uniref:Gfo/Idh/MocA family oxidoreductase n=1 Tax=Listeria sp. PSOL-1 TaxID=1844999 RepID=UPI0013D36F8F|nr:Gfo/Idh/MocA family oxidoreductase [Listeria sp. PSOL-1]
MNKKLSKRVLMVGFGTMGRIMLKKWLNYVENVDVVDINHDPTEKISKRVQFYSSLEKLNQAISPSFFYDVVYICVPTDKHLQIIEELLIAEYPFKKILIEKPLTNDIHALNKINNLVEKYSQVGIQVFVQEQYYLSSALEALEIICGTNEIIQMEIEMSKDRTLDEEKGRFKDTVLGTFGIEFPHMLAILDKLNLLEQFEITDVEYLEPDSFYSGVTVQGESSGINIILKSHLDAKNIKRNVAITSATGEQWAAWFDPIPNFSRYYSSICDQTEINYFFDDMLDQVVQRTLSGQLPTYFDVSHASKIVDKLFALKCHKGLMEKP